MGAHSRVAGPPPRLPGLTDTPATKTIYQLVALGLRSMRGMPLAVAATWSKAQDL